MALDPNTTLPGTGDVYAATERTVAGVLAKLQHLLVNAGDGPSCDAFGRWRVSEPETIFDSKLIMADQAALFWQNSLESGTMALSAPTLNKPYTDFTSSNTTAGERIRQTYQHFTYQPGKSQFINMTGVLELASGVKTGCVREMGYYTAANGVFLQSNAGTINLVTRTNDSGSPVDTSVAQASWNLDNFDGGADAANPSGVTMDWTKAIILVIDFQWLSVGRVRVGFEIAGVIHYAHQFLAANTIAIPWSSTPNLPVRYRIVTTTDSGICSMRCICAAVMSEGGTNDTGLISYHSTEGAAYSTDTENSIHCVLALRRKAAHIGGRTRVKDVGFLVESASEKLEWLLIHNPTVASTALSFSDEDNNGFQRAVGITANKVTIGSTGLIMGGGYITSDTGGAAALDHIFDIKNTLSLGAKIDGTQDVVALCIRPVSGVSVATLEASITMQMQM